MHLGDSYMGGGWAPRDCVLPSADTHEKPPIPTGWEGDVRHGRMYRAPREHSSVFTDRSRGTPVSWEEGPRKGTAGGGGGLRWLSVSWDGAALRA